MFLTYSKSPGLLSMPTFGGAIQLAYLPGFTSGFISDWMKSPSAWVGSQFVAALVHSRRDQVAIRIEVLDRENTPILRLNAFVRQLHLEVDAGFSMILFQRPTPPAASLHVIVAQAHVDRRQRRHHARQPCRRSDPAPCRCRAVSL
jgi:hypothetical protein